MRTLVFYFVFLVFAASLAKTQHPEPVQGIWYDNFARVGSGSGLTYSVAIEPEGNFWLSQIQNHPGFPIVEPRLTYWNGRNWIPKDPGFNGDITRIILDQDNNLYVAGLFTEIGDIEANHIAMYDGENWHALGNGLSRSGFPNPVINALAIDDEGRLYVGGIFTQAGGKSTSNIARWDGDDWFIPGSNGLNNNNMEVNDMTVDNGILYLATRNADINNGLVRYDIEEDEWLDPIILSLASFSEIRGVAVASDGKIYLGGNFSTISGLSANRIAYYDPETSEFFAMGQGASGNVNYVVIDSQDQVYVAGNFTAVDDMEARHVARWDGQQWHDMNVGIQGRRSIGNPNPTTANPNQLVIGPDDGLYVTGQFNIAGDDLAFRIARWHDDQWHNFGNGISGSAIHNDTAYGHARAMMTLSSGNIIIGTSSPTVGGVHTFNHAVWDKEAENWIKLGEGLGSSVLAFAEDSQGNIYAGGNFTTIFGGIAANRIARWDGEVWAPMGEGFSNGEVRSVLVVDDVVYAGGTFSNRLSRWNGSEWESVASITGSIEKMVLTPEGDIILAGVSRIDGEDFNKVALWDGENFHHIGEGIPGSGTVNNVVFNVLGEIVVGGTFSFETEQGTASRVAVFRDGEWLPLGEGFTIGSVNALAAHPAGPIFAGGTFDFIGDDLRSDFAVWNGVEWLPFDVDINDGIATIHSLAIDHDGDVFVGGNFRYINQLTSGGIAMWSGHVDYAGDYRLTITVEGEGITDPDAEELLLPAGETVTITAIPNEGFGFEYWELDGEQITDNPISFTMDFNTQLKVVFAEGGTTSVTITDPDEGIKVFPNPTNHVVNIRTDENMERLLLTDLTGRILMEEILSGKEARLNTSDILHGIYILMIETDSGIHKRKIQIVN